MDIRTAAQVASREDEGIVIPVLGPDGEPDLTGDPPEQTTITVAGTYSSRYRRALDAQRKQVFSRAIRRRPDSEDAQRQALTLVASCVIAWHGFTDNGQPYLCTRDNIMALFDKAPWVLQQVEAGMEDHQGFFKAASPNSPSA